MVGQLEACKVLQGYSSRPEGREAFFTQMMDQMFSNEKIYLVSCGDLIYHDAIFDLSFLNPAVTLLLTLL